MVKAKNIKMRKAVAGLISGVMIVGLAGCGASANGGAIYDGYNKGVYQESMDMAVSTGSSSLKDSAWESPSYSYSKDSFVDYEAKVETGETVTTSTRKTIKTAKLSLQTLDFDAFVVALEQKVTETGAYFQYADVSGTNYYGGRRYASYTVRVPEANLNAFLAGIDGIATVTNKTLGEQDVTLSYVDTESRIKALEMEQESLFELLGKATDLDAIIRLQDRLSEVRYELENYKAQLRTYDDKISYSTVTLSVTEVTKVTQPEPETVWERVRRGFGNTMDDIVTGAQDFFVWVVTNIPYLVFWGVVIVLAIVFFKKRNKKRKQKKIEKQRAQNGTEMGSEE